jgi:hypothetical protein
MAEIIIRGSNVGTQLQELLLCDEIAPGSEPSYQICKTIYLYHPLGAKMVDAPIEMAQSQEREISVPGSPEDRVKEAFRREWAAIGADIHIANVMRLSRTYGVASIAMLRKGEDSLKPVNFEKLYDSPISFNVYDPLNTSGSLVLQQNPNAMDFQKVTTITVAGQTYNRSRTCVILNEEPIYIAYTTSAFGYVGRSVYQRALFPLKSFVQTLITDDMIARKAGVLIAKMDQPGSIIDNLMQKMAGVKRALLKEAQTNNVISISAGTSGNPGEEIESLNMQNLEGPYTLARTNILKNIATAAGEPAKLLENETMVAGFGEGTEDAKNIAKFIDRFRVSMKPLYDYFDKIVMYRAWNPDFYATIQADFPEYKGKPFTTAFVEWQNAFTTAWPNLLTEPPSELVKVDDAKLKAAIACFEVLVPTLDPENKTTAVAWLCDQFNELKLLFKSPLVLDFEALASYVPPEAPKDPGEPKPFAASDSAGKGMAQYVVSVADLISHLEKRERPHVSRLDN